MAKNPNRLSGDFWGRSPSDALEQHRQARFQPFGDPINVHQRNIPHAPLYAAVLRPVQAAPLRCLFLIDSLLLADATNGAAKPDVNFDGHSLT